MCSIGGMDVHVLVCMYVVVREFMATNDCDFGPRIGSQPRMEQQTKSWVGWVLGPKAANRVKAKNFRRPRDWHIQAFYFLVPKFCVYFDVASRHDAHWGGLQILAQRRSLNCLHNPNL